MLLEKYWVLRKQKNGGRTKMPDFDTPSTEEWFCVIS